MATRIFLGLSALLWLPYGLYCFFDPHALGDAAGVTAVTPTAVTEIRAMYGGAQIAIGALALAALLRAELLRPALVCLAFLTTGLATTRLVGTFIDGAWSAYTLGALGFEILSMAVAITLLRRMRTG